MVDAMDMGICPHGQGAFAQIAPVGGSWDYAHMPNMRKSDEKEALRQLLIERIEARRDELGLTDNEVATAGGNRYIMRDLRGRGSIPSSDKLGGIAALLGVSVDWLMGRTTDPTPPTISPPMTFEARPADVGDVSRMFRQFPQDLPIYGTAFGHNMNFGEDGNTDIEVTLFEPTERIGFALRPPALFGDKLAYAFRIQGDSMFPAHKPGNLRIAQPNKPPQIEDDVIVQLRVPIDDGDHGEEIVAVLIKTLVKRTADYVVLRQYNPLREFRVPRHMIASIHLVQDPGDLLDR